MLEQQLKAVGPRLRQLRGEAGQTLAEVSAATGISVSTISRLEQGLRQPTLELLLPLAQLYAVPLDHLVNAADESDPRVAQKPFVRNGSTFVPLTRVPGRLQAYKQTLPPWDGVVREQKVHDGYDWMYVLSGQLRLLLGPHDLELGPGEVAEFDTRVPHAFFGAGESPTELLTFFGTSGERMHVRASTGREK